MIQTKRCTQPPVPSQPQQPWTSKDRHWDRACTSSRPDHVPLPHASVGCRCHHCACCLEGWSSGQSHRVCWPRGWRPAAPAKHYQPPDACHFLCMHWGGGRSARLGWAGGGGQSHTVSGASLQAKSGPIMGFLFDISVLGHSVFKTLYSKVPSSGRISSDASSLSKECRFSFSSLPGQAISSYPSF